MLEGFCFAFMSGSTLIRRRRKPRLHSARKIRNPFRWSSSSGREQLLKTGTMCEAAIIVEEQPLIRADSSLDQEVPGNRVNRGAWSLS